MTTLSSIVKQDTCPLIELLAVTTFLHHALAILLGEGFPHHDILLQLKFFATRATAPKQPGTIILTISLISIRRLSSACAYTFFM